MFRYTKHFVMSSSLSVLRVGGCAIIHLGGESGVLKELRISVTIDFLRQTMRSTR